MVYRLQKLHKINSLFLFGARGTGKTTLLKEVFGTNKGTLWIDLLTDEDEECFQRNPDELIEILKGGIYSRVIIDEIQKIPKLLDIVHKSLEIYKNIQFIMTGSSSRKLRRGAANLLAGRAFVYNLYPFTYFETLDVFSLEETLNFGNLPRVFEYNLNEDKKDFLKSYSRTYLKEEIQMEQIVRKMDDFRNFLEVAAQVNGQILNYSKISRDVGVDDKTVAQYFQILEDTHIGFLLPSHHRSIRKQQISSPKFYFFDLGVKKALERSLDVLISPQTYAFGQAFEHFIILECYRLNEYFKTDYRFSYIKSKEGQEVDLVINRGKKKEILVEIKSSEKVTEDDIKGLKKLVSYWDRPYEVQLWSQDKVDKTLEGVTCLHWKQALEKIWKNSCT